MPSFETYKRIKGNTSSIGQAHKEQSDIVYEATWDRDIDSRVAYIYDQDRDDEYDLTDDLHPYNSKTKIPVEIKFFEMEYNSLSKDETGYHIAFKPSFDYKSVVPYYDKEYGNVVDSIFPIGQYLDIPDSKGIFHRYIVVGQYRYYSNQFPSFIVLPCDFKLRWVAHQKKYSCWCALRSQSSYNSGVWTDYKITTIENQKLVWLPYNPTTVEIFYDTRCAISGPRQEPIVWSVSKVEDMNTKGIIRLTFKQDKWKEHVDLIEYNEEGEYVGAWCDYYTDGVPIAEEDHTIIPSPTIHSIITFSGIKPEIKIHGSYKKFTVKFYDDEENENVILTPLGTWEFKIGDDYDASDLIVYEDITPEGENMYKQIKVKFIGEDEWIGKNLHVWYVSDESIKSHIDVNIVGM